MATHAAVIDITAAARERFVGRFMESAAGTLNILCTYLGDRLGFYDTLAAHGPMTSRQLAERTGTHERYVREWLEQQTVAGFLQVENCQEPYESRRFLLPEAHRDVLANPESLDYLAPLAQMLTGVARPMPQLLGAFRGGGGVPYSAYGEDMHQGQARMNRAMFLQQLGPEWLASIPDVHARLSSDPPARVADIGCGHGWSSIGIARTYPNVQVDGFDSDRASVDRAHENAWKENVAGRVLFSVSDVSEAEFVGRYDLAIALECLHDMSDPVGALRNMRRLAGPTGAVIIVDERVGHSFTPTGADLEWLMYGFSVLHCLPSGMAEQPSAATGTVMRPSTVKRYAAEAGFQDVEILPIDHSLFRFYRLRT